MIVVIAVCSFMVGGIAEGGRQAPGGEGSRRGTGAEAGGDGRHGAVPSGGGESSRRAAGGFGGGDFDRFVGCRLSAVGHTARAADASPAGRGRRVGRTAEGARRWQVAVAAETAPGQGFASSARI
ncbi:hypothetical protein GCM10009540_16480 [Streptomyces turgidiscabies]